jgi:RHS repeat-associated protein
MTVPNRHDPGNSYRYGFQGQEKDNEIKGDGNSLNYTFRMHDPRVGRFFARDPLSPKYPFYSPYQFSGNKVVQFIELEGCEEKTSQSGSSNATIAGTSEVKSIFIQDILLTKQQTKKSWWNDTKTGRFLKGAAIGVATTIVVVGLVALTGPAGVTFLATYGTHLAVVGTALTIPVVYEVVAGENMFTGKKISELERSEKAGNILGGLVGGFGLAKGLGYLPKVPATVPKGSAGVTAEAVLDDVASSGASMIDDAATGGVGKTVDFVTGVQAKSFGKVVGEGIVHVRPSITAIENGSLLPRNATGYSNKELHIPLLGKPEGYWQEYHLLEFGSKSPLRILRGEQGESFLSPDHYKSIIPLNH